MCMYIERGRTYVGLLGALRGRVCHADSPVQCKASLNKSGCSEQSMQSKLVPRRELTALLKAIGEPTGTNKT